MTQKAIVKEISVKEGGEGKKAWKNTRITTAEGAVIGTFEAEATTLKAGDEIEFEPEIDGKYVNIKKGTFKLLKAAESAPAQHQNGKDSGAYKRDTEGIAFEYRLKAEMQALERVSIEAQTAYSRIMEVAIAGIPIDEAFAPLFAKALQWADMKLKASMGMALVSAPVVAPEPARDKAQTGQGVASGPSEPGTTPVKAQEPLPKASQEFPNVAAMWKALENMGISSDQAHEVAGSLGAHMQTGGTRGQYFDLVVKVLKGG